MPLPGSPANALPADDAALMRRIEGIERQLRELGPSVSASFGPVIADLADLIDRQVSFLADFTDATGPFTLTTTEAELATYSFTVPDGFTRALVVGYGSVGLVNPTASTGSLAGRIYIDAPSGSVWGPRRHQSTTAGWDAATFPYKQTVLTGLTGGESVTVRLVALVWPSTWTGASGGASLNVQAYFSRI